MRVARPIATGFVQPDLSILAMLFSGTDRNT